MAAERDRPRRNPPTGGYPRGVETRGRIVTAALKVFGEEGYERASTRTIAREAGVRPPALQYYFDSKDGLHLACGQRILDDALGVLSPAILDAERRATRGLALDAVEALCDLLDAFVDASLITAQSPAAGRFLARAQSDEWSPARDLVHENLTRPVHHLCARLVALGTGCAVDDDVRLRTSVILGQVSVLRESTLKIIGWRDFAGVRLDAVKTVLRAHTRASLQHGSLSP